MVEFSIFTHTPIQQELNLKHSIMLNTTIKNALFSWKTLNCIVKQ